MKREGEKEGEKEDILRTTRRTRASLLHLLQRSQAGVGLEGLAQGTRSISANVVRPETVAREGRRREKKEGGV